MRKKTPGYKYVLGEKERCNIQVHPSVHKCIKVYADSKNMTITEATWELLRRGFQSALGEDPRHDMWLPIHRHFCDMWEKRTGEKVPKRIRIMRRFPFLDDMMESDA